MEITAHAVFVSVVVFIVVVLVVVVVVVVVVVDVVERTVVVAGGKKEMKWGFESERNQKICKKCSRYFPTIREVNKKSESDA